LSELKPGQQYTVHLSAGNDVDFGPSVKFIVNTPTSEQSGSLPCHALHFYARFVGLPVACRTVPTVRLELSL